MFTNQIDSEKIGANIKHLLKEKNLPKSKFTDMCMKHYIINGDEESAVRIVNRWLSGGVKNLSTACELANVLEVDVMTILF